MRDINSLFDELGGPLGIEAATGISANHLRQMKLRQSIPLKYWPALLDMAENAGKELSEADLLRMHVPVPSDAPAPQQQEAS